MIDVKVKRVRMDEICTPIFDLGMGTRMKLMRMRLLLDQAQLAERLGMHQSTISDIELGRLAVTRNPITVNKLKEVFGNGKANFILFGRSPEKYPTDHIIHTYWDYKMKVTAQRPNQKGENHWFYKRANKNGGKS